MQTSLLRSGFIKIARRINPKPFVMTVHDLVAESPQEAAWAGWNFHWGDMDVV